MTIWQEKPTLNEINQDLKNTLCSFLEIEVTKIEGDCIVATMPVNEKTKQPSGLLHGGASCVLAETLGSLGALLCVDRKKYTCVGLEINTNHIKMVKSGFVEAKATPLHLGRSTQVWDIKIYQEKLVAVSRLTIAVLEKS